MLGLDGGDLGRAGLRFRARGLDVAFARGQLRPQRLELRGRRARAGVQLRPDALRLGLTDGEALPEPGRLGVRGVGRRLLDRDLLPQPRRGRIARGDLFAQPGRLRRRLGRGSIARRDLLA